MPYAGQHSTVAPRSGPRRFVVLTLALFWGALSVAGLNGDVSSARTPTPSQAVVANNQVTAPTPPRTSEPSATFKPGRVPIQISIPAIQVTAGITELGLNKDGTVEVPKNPDKTGWYRKGPMPGEPGSAVILGHVDSKVGPAVFYRLKNLDPGDQIAVKLDSGSVAHFEVTRVAQYPIEDFPRYKVYAGKPDRPALNLVTCGGKYDREAGGYQSNVVVYTTYLWATDGVRRG